MGILMDLLTEGLVPSTTGCTKTIESGGSCETVTDDELILHCTKDRHSYIEFRCNRYESPLIDDCAERLMNAYINSDMISASPSMQKSQDHKCIAFPAKLDEAIDVLFSHNSVIALWYSPANEGTVRLWRGEAWALPDEYRNLLIMEFFGAVADTVLESDTINMMVNATDETPRNLPKKTHDIENCSDSTSASETARSEVKEC